MGKVNSGPLQLANRQIEVLDKKFYSSAINTMGC